jgi:SAM-dependent methyltransferase
MRPADYFNRLYSECERYWWQDKEDRYSTDPEAYPFSLLTQMTLRLLQGKRPGRALDIGTGEGTDAIRLARLGYEVDAFDVSEVAAEKVRQFAARANVKVNAFVADAATFAADGRYDVVISNGVLQYVEDKEGAVSRMHEATEIGGINVVSLWSTYTPVPSCHDKVPVFPDDEQGMVTKLYSYWPKHLVYFERAKAESSHSDLPPHAHSHIKLIARKPG